MPLRKPLPPLTPGQRVWVLTGWAVAGWHVRFTWDPGAFVREANGRAWINLDNGHTVSRPTNRVRTSDPNVKEPQ